MNSFDDKNEKKSNQFTIMKDDPIDGHPGYSGGGAISLENMSPLVVDPNEDKVWVDMGAMHARSEVEKRIKFVTEKKRFQMVSLIGLYGSQLNAVRKDLIIMVWQQAI